MRKNAARLKASSTPFDQMAEIERRHLYPFIGTSVAIMALDEDDVYAEQFE